MPTIKLVPSTYSVSNNTVTVSNANNMYTDTSSTNYATITHTTSGTTSYYLYLKGFNFNDVPNSANVSSITIRIRGYESGLATSTSYAPRLYNNTSTITGASAASSNFSTSVNTITVPYTGTWSTLKNYGANLGIRLTVRRNSRNTQCYIYVYGAEIEVTYTVPNPRTVTTTLNGNGTIDPSGTETYYDGDTYNLTITPQNSTDEVTVKNNGTDVTSQLVEHIAGNDSRVLGAYTLVSGSFNGSGASYFQGLVGKGVNNTQTTSNYYSGGNGTIAVFTYDVGFDLPASATITRVYAQVNGHAESTSQSSEYMCARLISGSTNLSSELNFKSVGTSNSTQTIECTTLPTVSQLAVMKLQCRLGYYGGAINGATIYVEATSDEVTYTYSFTISGDATIVVTIGASQAIYYKEGGDLQFVNYIYVNDPYSNTFYVDLSSISVGDSVSVQGTLYQMRAGVEVLSSRYDISTVFTWTGNSYSYTVGFYTLTIYSDRISIAWTYAGSGYDYALHAEDYRINIYKSANAGWVQAQQVYKKINGSWVLQSDLSNVFDSTKNYVKG